MVKISLKKKFTAKVKKLLDSPNGAEVLRRAMEDGLERAGLYAQSEAVQRAPVRTGTLRRGIQLRREFSTKRKRVIVGVNGKTIPYARIQEYGGIIVPKNKKFLAFKVNGKMVFAKKVRIPAHPYIRPTAKIMKNGKLLEILHKSVSDVIK